MADDVKKPSALITEIQHDSNTSLEQPMGGSGKATTSQVDNPGASIEFGADGKPLSTTAAPAAVLEGGEAAALTEEVAASVADEVALEALGEWKVDDPEVAAKFEARYFSKEGKLKLDAVTKEFYANAKAPDKDGKGGLVGTLHEETYKFLEDTLGITKEAAQQIERGLVADGEKATSAFYSRVGGKERYNAAVEWGKKNYTPAQRERFNALTSGSDAAARDDAVDALLARFDKATPHDSGPARRGPPSRRAAPERTVAGQGSTAAGGSSVAAPYKTQADYTEAFQKAINAERDAKSPLAKREATAAREKVRADGRRSQAQWR